MQRRNLYLALRCNQLWGGTLCGWLYWDKSRGGQDTASSGVEHMAQSYFYKAREVSSSAGSGVGCTGAVHTGWGEGHGGTGTVWSSGKQGRGDPALIGSGKPR